MNAAPFSRIRFKRRFAEQEYEKAKEDLRKYPIDPTKIELVIWWQGLLRPSQMFPLCHYLHEIPVSILEE